jgi:retron-type reverse transcriptase
MEKRIINAMKKRWEEKTEISLEQYFRTAKTTQLIEKKSREGKEKFENLYSLLEREDFILQMVMKINKNKGIDTKRVNKKSMDGFGMKDVRELQNEIKNGKYQPSPVLLKYPLISPGKKKKTPLGTLKDKIVQGMVNEILTAIYEPVFEKKNVFFFCENNKVLSLCSFLGKGVRHTLEEIEKKAINTRWCIEGEIKGAYDNVNHKRMIRILCEKIKDQKLIKLVKNMLKSGIMERREYENTTYGTPEGGIVSPILFNIYMSKLDEKMREEFLFQERLKILEKENKVGRARNLQYEKLNNAIESITRWRKRMEKKKGANKRLSLSEKDREREASNKNRVKELLRVLLLLLLFLLFFFRERMKSKEERDSPHRTVYARNADGWILITNGSKKRVEEKKEVIKRFLKEELKLELSKEKTKRIDLRRKRAKFLGFELFYIRAKKRIAGTYSSRWTPKRLTIRVDMEKVLNRLEEKGFIDRKGWGRAKNPWTVKSDYEIVENFNWLVRGIIGYYAQGVGQFQQIDRIRWILDMSCKKTLAKKHDMSSIKIIKKYGDPVTATIEKEGKKYTIKQMGRKESKKYYEIIRRGF